MTMYDKPPRSMKFRKILNWRARSLAAVFMLTITVPVLHADIVARDNFDYSLGSIDGANGGIGNWTGAWDNFGRDAHSELVSPDTPLTYRAGEDAHTLGGGTALQFTRQADPVQTPVLRSFSGLTAGESVYFRYLLRLDSDTWDVDDFFTGWLDSDSGKGELDVRGNGPNLGLRAANAGSNDFFARVNNDTGAEAIPSIAFASQKTYLIVGLYEDSDNDGFYDTASIWINPTRADADSPHAVSTVGISSIPDPMAWLGWRFGNTLDTNDILLVDDVAVTTTFDSAIGVNTEPPRIVPFPKEVSFSGDFVPVSSLPETVSLEPSARKMFNEEMDFLGHRVATEAGSEGLFRLGWGRVDEMALNDMLQSVPDRQGGYVLEVTQEGVGVIARERSGLLNGIQTLMQLMEQSTDGRIACVSVQDWPDFSFRGFHMPLRPPGAFGVQTMDEALATYKWFIRRLARYKYTHLNLMIIGSMVFESRPELETGPWTASDIQSLIGFARDRGIDVFPEVKTLGKFFHNFSEERLADYANLLEPRKYIGQLDYQAQYHEGFSKQAARLEEEQRALEKEKNATAALSGSFQVDNPAVLEFLRPVLDEVHAAFEEPEFFHIGSDESFYTAINAAPEDRGRLLAEHINRVADYLQAKGSRVVMWNDMLVSHEQFPYFFEAHGGPPLNMWTAADHLDRDIIMTCWHYGYTVGGNYPKNYPMVAWLAGKGFPVIGVPWFRADGAVNLARNVAEVNGLGMMGSSWAIHMAVRDARGLLDDKTSAQVAPRREFSVLAMTAETAWSPDTAAVVLESYDPEAWEKRWFKRYWDYRVFSGSMLRPPR